MRYGYFDEVNMSMLFQDRILRPLANYLGSPEYGAIISNNAGGYSFVKVELPYIRYIFNQEDSQVDISI